MRGTPGLLRLLAATAVAVTVLFGSALPASAHAGLASTVPATGTVLPTAPDDVRLSFTEPVSPVRSAFVLYDSTGPTVVDGEPAALTVVGLDTVVTVSLPSSLPRGSYLLGWRVVSADSHPVSGVVEFAVGVESAEPPVTPTTSDPRSLTDPTTVAALIAQVLGYLALFTAVGLRGFDLVRGDPTSRVGARLGRISTVVAVVAFGSLVGLTVLRERAAPLSDLTRAATWRAGVDTPALATLALASAGGLLLALRLRGRLAVGAVVLGALVATASVLPTGHTRTVGPLWLMSGLDLVHALTAAVWLGGVIGLGLHLHDTRQRQRDPVAAAAVVARFSAVAGVVVGLLGASGVAMAVLVLDTPRALVSTAYGRTLLVKVALSGVIALLALGNKMFLVGAVRRRPGLGPQWRRLRAAVLDEALLLVVVIAVTGLLTQQSPTRPAGPSSDSVVAASAGPAASDLQRVELGTGSLQARLQPGTVGTNTFEFTVRDADGGPQAVDALPEVSATLPSAGLGPLRATVTRLDGTGHFRAQLPLPAEGAWRIVVSVRLGRFDEPTATVVVPVSG